MFFFVFFGVFGFFGSYDKVFFGRERGGGGRVEWGVGAGGGGRGFLDKVPILRVFMVLGTRMNPCGTRGGLCQGSLVTPPNPKP